MSEKFKKKLNLLDKNLPRELKVLLVLFSLFFSIPLTILNRILDRR